MTPIEHLTLVRWGTRFADPKTEAEYARWHVVHALPFNRAEMIAAAVVWLAMVGLMLWIEPPNTNLWIALVLGVVFPLSALVTWTTYRRSLFPYSQISVAIANCMAGCVVVAMENLLLDGGPSQNLGPLCIAIYFTSVVARLRPWTALIAMLPYVVAELAMLEYLREIKQRTLNSTIFDMFVVIVSFVTGVIINVVIDAVARRTFRQERIIEAQQEEIVRERARSEALLKQELGHQVAARSRELGQMLAKVESALVVDKLAPGARFDTRYEVVRPLGAGGMGAVYEVERKTDGQRLALKIVTGDVTGTHAARFAREAEIGARLSHPHLITIVDVGISQGVPFLAMELALGGSLEDRRDRFGDAAFALPILAQIADGLGALHAAGVVHRDLKPANVLFGDDGHAKISDFGISRAGALDSGDVDARAETMKPLGLTATGMLLGTPFYMAPEAARGARAIAEPADIYALGVIATELLTGKAPFDTPALFLAFAAQPLPAPKLDGIEAELRTVIAACLAQNPAERPAIAEVRAAFCALRSGSAEHSSPISP